MTSYVKMLKTVEVEGEEFAQGDTYELDQETATKWIDNGRCEKAADPADEMFSNVTKAVDEKIKGAIDKLADSIKVTSDAPRIDVKPEAKSLGDFCKLFATDKTKLANKYGEKVLSIGTDTAVVPTPLFSEVLQSTGFEFDLLAKVNQIEMISDTLKFPVLNQAGVSPTGGQSAYFGGVVGAFDSEDDDVNDTEPAWTSRTLNAAKYTMSTIQTLEFRQDSISPEQKLVELFQGAYRDHMTYFVLNGTGAVEGVIDDAATLAVTRTTANLVKYADIVAMVAGMASDGPNWAWIASPGAYGQLLNLVDASGHLVFDATHRREMFGYPVLKCQHASALGTAGDLLLANLKAGYVFGNRMGAEISFSDHVGFLKGRRYWKLEARVAGLPTHQDTITLADGSTEVSEVVQLGAVAS